NRWNLHFMRTSDETRRLFGFAIFTALVTTIPYLIAFARSGEEWVFTGFLFAVEDGNSYIAKMLSGTHGAWAFRSPYSTTPQTGLLGVYLPYILLGKLAGGAEVHLQLVVIFHLFRIAAVFLYVYAVYDFMSVFVRDPAGRFLGTALGALGGGLGWLLVLAGQGSLFGELPLDFYSPEAFGFLALFGLPHLAAGRALTLWGFATLLAPGGEPGIRRGLRAGLLWLAAGFFNPLSPAIALLVSGLYFIFVLVRPAGETRTRVIAMFTSAALLPLLMVIYHAAASQLDPFFRAWSAQNTIHSPHPLHYLAGYAIYLPWAIKGARRLLVSGAVRARLPVIWVLVFPILVYLPVNLQRRLSEGVFIALLALVVCGFEREPDRARSMRKSVPLIAAAIPTTLLLLAGAGQVAWYPAEPAFRPSVEAAAVEILAAHAPIDSIVLAPVGTGNALPAFAPLRVVIGHGPETIGFDRLRPEVDAFFENRLSNASARALLVEQGVDYIFWQEPEQPVYPDLDLQYEGDGFRIYTVPPPP
ncbi:MAG TPA: hypothetical protein VMN57_07740, partial [Anaerolineales bacterium]|nr:hypothetical protein [Anaerolineales bacterium]